VRARRLTGRLEYTAGDCRTGRELEVLIQHGVALVAAELLVRVGMRHHQRVAAPNPGEGGGDLWAGAAGARGEFLEDLVSARRVEGVRLRVQVSVLGGDAGIADQGQGRSSGASGCPILIRCKS
jgi:hypothetical protein